KLVSIDMFVKLLPQKVRFYITVFNQIVIIIFLLALIGYGTWLSYITRFRTFQGIPGFSYTWVTISVPIGSLLMLITAIRQIREEYRNIKKNSASSPA
ncbi:MAG: TRAP transporter small permease, partial [Firmicutes bacterium]|nr:TRAP transporter small permease [Bacillota bacterium]